MLEGFIEDENSNHLLYSHRHAVQLGCSIDCPRKRLKGCRVTDDDTSKHFPLMRFDDFKDSREVLNIFVREIISGGGIVATHSALFHLLCVDRRQSSFSGQRIWIG